MAVPRSLEPLVLYLAAMPHPASAALVVVREERQAKGLPHDSTCSVKMTQPQGGAPEATATPTGGQAPEVHQPPKAHQLQEISDYTNNPALIEHPVYFVSTVLRDARARYPMP